VTSINAQVAPTEIENILIKMEGVADIAVVGVPDDRAGELPKAFIVRKPGSNITAEDVAKYLQPKVADYKQLKGGIQFLDAIPKSAAGKILRKDLRNL
jgi:4-coumarate--CoA ligase